MSRKFRVLSLCIVLLLLLSSCGRADQPASPAAPTEAAEPAAEGQEPAAEKPVISGMPVYGSKTLKERLDQFGCFVYGVVRGRSEETFEHITTPTVDYGWLYHEIYVEVLECLPDNGTWKPGDTFTYRELGGENDRYIFVNKGTHFVSEGDLVFILNPENTFLSPYSLLPVEGDRVYAPFELFPDLTLEADEEKRTYLTVDDFRAYVVDLGKAKSD